MTRKYFGTDGVRGRANSGTMTADMVLKIGMAAGNLYRRGNHRHRVVIGKDTRLSGYMIENALASGLLAAGMDVFLFGPVPTPAVSMLTRSMRADLGVMISASHNPFADNGIKIFGPDGFKLSDEQELEIEAMLDDPALMSLAAPETIGRAKRIEDAQARYIEFAKRTYPKDMTLDGLRVVIDTANGAAYKVAPTALWELGAEVVQIGAEPNGININDGCGSTHPEAMCAKVKELRADIGIALDGDADRVIIADDKGQVVDGDQLMALIASSWARRGELRGGGLVATIMSNLGLERFLADQKLTLARTKVGARPRPQCRRRTIGPHRAVRLLDDRRRPPRRSAGARRSQAPGQARERRVQSLHTASAGTEEREVQDRCAAPGQSRALVDRGCRSTAGELGPSCHPSVGNGAGDPCDGRRRR